LKNIKLLKNFYSIGAMSEIFGVSENTLRSRITVMEITPDIQINDINHYSEHSKNRLLGVYEFEKTNQEIIYFERNNKPKEKFETFESKMNN